MREAKGIDVNTVPTVPHPRVLGSELINTQAWQAADTRIPPTVSVHFPVNCASRVTEQKDTERRVMVKGAETRME